MKQIITVAILLFSLANIAQTKVGTINNEYILSKMDEIKSVEKEMQLYNKKLDSTIQTKYADYKSKLDKYNEEEADMNDVMKKIKQSEIIDLEEDLQKLQQNSSKMLQIKQDELLRPLYNKIGNALEVIVEEEGFTQVFDENNSIIYIDPEFDLTLKVMKSMGIEIEEKNPDVTPE